MPFEPEWLYLDELLPLLGPSPDLAHVEAVVSRALDEGRLRDRTSTPVNAWHERFEQADGKFVFNWTSGEMIIPYWNRGRREYQPRPVRPQFRRADFLAIFDMASKEAVEIMSKETAPKAVSEAKVRRWYQERYDSWPEGKKAPNRDQDYAAASNEFRGISRAFVRKARNNIAKKWTEGGRPRKLVDENLAEYLAEENLAENLAENSAGNPAKKAAGD